MKLVQSWDDGVTTDVRLTDLLRAAGTKATFNLNAGLHGKQRSFGWRHGEVEVWRLAQDELPEVYRGFEIANHTLSHPCLVDLPLAEARLEIDEGRRRLEQLFGQPVAGFAYPFGRWNPAVVQAVRDSGHRYGRTTEEAAASSTDVDPWRLGPHCHFQAPDFWERFERARPGGVFHFWGHSHEMSTETDWQAFAGRLKRLGEVPGAGWCTVIELFNREGP